jgi:hypothetical protein
MEAISEVSVLGGLEVRSAAFQRLVHTAWSMTKGKRDAFPIDLESKVQLDKADEVLAIMIMEINASGSANACFSCTDDSVIANAAMKLLRAYINAPEIHSKIATCYLAVTVGSAITGTFDDREMAPMNRRSKEVLDVSKMFYDLSKQVSGKEVVPSATVRNTGRDDWLTFTVAQA